MADIVERAIPADAPVMKAWEAYRAREEYANNRKWAQTEEHVNGSMWAAFYEGFFACAVNETQRHGSLIDELTTLRAEVERMKD